MYLEMYSALAMVVGRISSTCWIAYSWSCELIHYSEDHIYHEVLSCLAMKILYSLWIKFLVIAILWFYHRFSVTRTGHSVIFTHDQWGLQKSPPLQYLSWWSHCSTAGRWGQKEQEVLCGGRWHLGAVMNIQRMYFVASLCFTCSLSGITFEALAVRAAPWREVLMIPGRSS